MVEERTPVEVSKGGEHMCFGCSPRNPIGFQLKVFWDGEKATAQFTPTSLHTGAGDTVHGGLLSTLLDEVMSYVPYCRGLNSVTGKLQVRFRHRARAGQRLLISAWMTRKRWKAMETSATITLEDATPVAEGTALMYILGQKGQV